MNHHAAPVSARGPERAGGRLRVPSDAETAFLRLMHEWSSVVQRVARLLAPSSSPDPDTLAGTLGTATWRRAMPRLVAHQQAEPPRAVLLSALVDEARAAGLLTAGPAAYRRPPAAGAADARWFRPDSDPEWPGHWATPPDPWPEPGAVDGDRLPVAGLAAFVARLPEPQRVVVALRDAGGCSTELISGLLEVSPGQVRRLLHSGRSSLRRSLDVTAAPS